MIESQTPKKEENQKSTLFLIDINNKLSQDSKHWELSKKSTQGSSNINFEINQTHLSSQNLFGENKFKKQYNKIKEEIEQNEKKFSKFAVKIDYKRSATKSRNSVVSNVSESHFKTEIVDIISRNNIDNFPNSTINRINLRKDAYGNPIGKNINKSYKVTFKDKVNKNITDNQFIKIYNVENYTKYNLKKDKDEVICSCGKSGGCLIF